MRFHLFNAPPTFDPDVDDAWEDPAHIETEDDAENSRDVALRIEIYEDFDHQDRFWILAEGAHPDGAEEWAIVQRAPRVEVQRLR